METEVDLQRKVLLWKTAIALQAVDGLETSQELFEIAKQNIEGSLPIEKAVVQAEELDSKKGDDTHANLVAARMYSLLAMPQEEFSLSEDDLCKIHEALFDEIVEGAGSFRQKNIAKKEWTLEGDVLYYPPAEKIPELLETNIKNEIGFIFGGMTSKEITSHIAKFISNLWQIHPFEKFNTQTIAIFFLKYLEYSGYAVTNESLVKHPVYFRNSLVRAVYDKNTIRHNTTYLEKLVENLVFGGRNKLDYKSTHFDQLGVVLKNSGKPGEKDIFGNDNPADACEPDTKTGVVIKGTKPKKAAPKKEAKPKKPATPKAPKPAKPKKEPKPKAEKKPAAKKPSRTKSKEPYVPTNPKVASICQNAKLDCNEKMEKILAFLLENKSATNSQAREAAGSSTETARKILVELAEKDIVRIEGANKNRVYWLN